jgi:hypothetical protein
MAEERKLIVERVQTGVRMEKRILKVLKGFAEYHDMTLGDLLEGIVLHAFDGKCPFGAESLKRIKELKKFYALDLDSRASHRLIESRASILRERTSTKNERAPHEILRTPAALGRWLGSLARVVPVCVFNFRRAFPGQSGIACLDSPGARRG